MPPAPIPPKILAPLNKLTAPPESAMYHHCSVGHDKHKSVIVQRTLPDGTELDYIIYDWRDYFVTVDDNETVSEHGKYCTGQDIISYSIDKQSVWEPVETAVILDILNESKTDDVVLDFGSHIGYYTIMAAAKGYRVVAFDASAENLEMLEASAETNRLSTLIYPYLCWLTMDTAPMLPDDAEDVHLLKVDIEGAEEIAVGMCLGLLGQKKIKYAILEVSPVFNDRYPGLVELVASKGYDVYQLPPNPATVIPEFQASPLEYVKANWQLYQEGRREHIAHLQQENLLFVRRDDDAN